MADYVVIYDPQLQLSALVDMEALRGVGPVSPGPDAKAQLEAFVASMPDAVLGNLTSYNLVDAYKEYWQRHFGNAAAQAAPVADTVESSGGAGSDATASATMEAIATAASPPPVQPFDTDMDADAGAATDVTTPAPAAAVPPAVVAGTAAPYVGPCFACGGSGTIPGAEGEVPQICTACHGTGKLPPPAN